MLYQLLGCGVRVIGGMLHLLSNCSESKAIHLNFAIIGIGEDGMSGLRLLYCGVLRMLVLEYHCYCAGSYGWRGDTVQAFLSPKSRRCSLSITKHDFKPLIESIPQ
jgi:hypothetical protein